MAMAVDRRNGSVWWMNASFVVLTAVSLALNFQGARGAGIGIGIGLGLGAAGLQFHFYFPTCPNLEDICMEVMQDAIDEDVGNAAGMIRLWFHECIVSVSTSLLSPARPAQLHLVPTDASCLRAPETQTHVHSWGLSVLRSSRRSRDRMV